jgi:hypothetical protein
MANTSTGEVLHYGRAIVPVGRDWLAIVALMTALFFNPVLRLAVTAGPFWTGHPLHWIREIVVSIPVLVLPLPGLVLGVSALALARLRGRRSGLALTATVIGVAWYLVLGGLFLFMVVALRGSPTAAW